MGRGDNHMNKDIWHMLGDARKYYMSITRDDFEEMDSTEKASWYKLTQEIENQIKSAKTVFEDVTNPEKEKG